jgi:MFS transporter, DHA2 family, multidrug resistance protein
MLVLDTSIANVALLYIAGSLAAGTDDSTWVITSYLSLCVALFTVASFLCGIASSLGALIFYRVLQGLGGGGMAPSEQAILADTFPADKRSQAFALYGVAVVAAPTIGPALGGWITDNGPWNWIFFINVPVGIASLALVQWRMMEPEALVRERRERFAGGLNIDWVGFVLVALWLGCIEVVFDKGQRELWFQSNFINTFAAISVVSFAAFVPWELKRKMPIVDVRLVMQRQFGMSFLVMLAVGATLFSTIQLLPQLPQSDYGYTAADVYSVLAVLALLMIPVALLLRPVEKGAAAG